MVKSQNLYGRKTVIRVYRLVVIAVLCTLGTVAAAAEPQVIDARFVDAVQDITDDIEAFREDVGAPGLNVAVSFNGELVWSQGFGVADIETGAPMRPDIPMPVGSLSKPLSSAVAARAAAQGLLDPDAPIRHYVPNFPNKGVVITTRQLAGHLGGIRAYNDADMKRLPDGEPLAGHLVGPYTDVLDALEIFEDDPLVAQPGSRFIYTTFGPVLLSAAVQGATKQLFQDYMAEELLQPLGMINTFPYTHEKCVEQCVGGYNIKRRSAHRRELVDLSYKWAGGGMVSTAEDLARFGSGILNRTDLFPEHIGQMLFTVQKAETGRMVAAWNWAPDVGSSRHNMVLEGHPSVWHSGGLAIGYVSLVQIFHDDNLVVAVTANASLIDKLPHYPLPSQLIAPAFLEAIAQRDDLEVVTPPMYNAGGCDTDVLRAELRL